MDDKQILEYAAKAVGGLVYVEDMGWIHEDENGNRGAWWNPKDDDGDSFRLAVDLDIKIEYYSHDSWTSPIHGIYFDESFSDHSGDKRAATRMAVLKVAAEIGKKMVE